MTEKPIAYRINRLHEVAPWARSTTYQLVREGRLPVRRLGSGVAFVLHEDLETFLRTLPSDDSPNFAIDF
ncbi:hypothetical protein GCM10022215_15160 [Nocardioides fonticola]|uniref:Helix-turn-helix domain-containing protein n=1 Tax=Nocardioides fonticola TaxID=450363 RepID=A0ABP7XHH1_9ACTN